MEELGNRELARGLVSLGLYSSSIYRREGEEAAALGLPPWVGLSGEEVEESTSNPTPSRIPILLGKPSPLLAFFLFPIT